MTNPDFEGWCERVPKNNFRAVEIRSGKPVFADPCQCCRPEVGA